MICHCLSGEQVVAIMVIIFVLGLVIWGLFYR